MKRSGRWVRLGLWLGVVVASIASAGCSKDTNVAPMDGSVPRDTGSASDANLAGDGGDTSDLALLDAEPTDLGDAAASELGSDVGPPGRDLYVSATLGDDGAGLGTPASPYRSLTHVMSLATSGDTVWMMDGTWDGTVDSPLSGVSAVACMGLSGVGVPTGVVVRAVNSGAAVVSVSGNYGLCLDGSALQGVAFVRTSGAGNPLLLRSGDNTLEGVSFGDSSGQNSYPHVVVEGGARVTWTPGSLARYATNIGALAVVRGADSELHVQGGAVDDAVGANFSNTGVFSVSDGGRLVLTDVLVERPVPNRNAVAIIAIRVAGGSVALRGTTTVRGFDNAQGMWLQDGASAAVTDDVVIEDNAFGVLASTSSTTPSTLTLSGNASIRGNGQAGVRGDLISGHDLVFEMSGTASVVNNGADGVLLSNGEVRILGGRVSNNGGVGISLGSSLRAFTMRNTVVRENGSSGVRWTSSGIVADLGTAGDPGANVIASNSMLTADVNLFVDAPMTNAVGNTWNPSVQGADTVGRFVGNVELVGQIVNMGSNFRINGVGQTLRLSSP